MKSLTFNLQSTLVNRINKLLWWLIKIFAIDLLICLKWQEFLFYWKMFWTWEINIIFIKKIIPKYIYLQNIAGIFKQYSVIYFSKKHSQKLKYILACVCLRQIIDKFSKKNQLLQKENCSNFFTLFGSKNNQHVFFLKKKKKEPKKLNPTLIIKVLENSIYTYWQGKLLLTFRTQIFNNS